MNNDGDLFGNQTCTIRPRWVNVNVTYVRDGFVTLEPTQTLPDMPLILSTIIQAATSTLEDHFYNSQMQKENFITKSIRGLPLPSDNEFMAELLVSTHYTIAPSH